MTVDPRTLGVGDVITTREGVNKIPSWAIQLGSRLRGRRAPVDHVIVAHHYDASQDRWWGLEARPGGVGWRDLTHVLSRPVTVANVGQPKTEEQRFLVAKGAEKMLHVPYDWEAIVHNARMAMRLDHLMGSREWLEDEQPTHYICSAYADWEYETVGLANPGGPRNTRFTAPFEWYWFTLDNGYHRPG